MLFRLLALRNKQLNEVGYGILLTGDLNHLIQRLVESSTLVSLMLIPKSLTAHALISMIDNWAQATDATGAAVRFVLLGYKKAFDLIDHQVLLQKIFSYCALGRQTENSELNYHTTAFPNGVISLRSPARN